jgi:hypothetical protein
MALTPDTLGRVLKFWPRYRWVPRNPHNVSKNELIYWWVKIYDRKTRAGRCSIEWFCDAMRDILGGSLGSRRVRFVEQFGVPV